MWLLKKVFYWHPHLQSWHDSDHDKVYRAYELWSHAELLISNPLTDFQLADALSNLKRALNQRLQMIESIYQIRQSFPKNQHFLNILGDLGAARPFIIKQLFDIRNEIEHNDKQPPSIDRCRELLDVTWYFLKSTDSFCKRQRNQLNYCYERYDETYFFELTIDFNPAKSQHFYGRVPQECVHKNEVIDSLKPTYVRRCSQLKDSPGFQEIRKIRPNLKGADYGIRGRVLLPKEIYNKVLSDLLLADT